MCWYGLGFMGLVWLGVQGLSPALDKFRKTLACPEAAST